jgi:hypothetical protein
MENLFRGLQASLHELKLEAAPYGYYLLIPIRSSEDERNASSFFAQKGISFSVDITQIRPGQSVTNEIGEILLSSHGRVSFI